MRSQPVTRKLGVETLLRPWPAFPLGVVVLLVGSFLYVWLRVEPLLEYHSYGPHFFQQWAFLEEHLGRPGGLASYAGVFLAQLNHLSWLGALAFTLSQCLVLLATLVCLASISGRAPGFVALVPVFVLLLLRNHYGYPVPAMSVGLLLALATSTAHVRLPWRHPWFSTAVSGLVSGLLFFLAGLWSALLYAVLVGMFAVIQLRNWPAGLGCMVWAWAAPWVAIGTGNLTIEGLFHPWPADVHWALAAALYASVPVAGAMLAWLPKPTRSPSADLRSGAKGEAVLVTGSGRWFQSTRLGQPVAVLAYLLGWAAVCLTFDRRQKLEAEIDYYASRGQYEAVLATARRAEALNHPAKVRLQLALFHTGRLAEDLFSFLNLIDDAPSKGIGEDCRAQSQPLFELGLVNDAEHMGHEALQLEGDRPDLLRLLARINLLKDRPQAAQVFLNVLSRIPFQGERANEAWPTTEPQMPLVERAFLAQIRARVLTNDLPHDGLPVGPLLEALLVSNPTNRMAFEYLMAHYLMELDLKNAVQRLPLLDNFGYAHIPKSYEEAVLLYQQAAGAPLELRGRTIRPETSERFRQFREAVRQLGGSAAGPAALAAKFGDSYWCYYYANLLRKRATQGQPSTP